MPVMQRNEKKFSLKILPFSMALIFLLFSIISPVSAFASQNKNDYEVEYKIEEVSNEDKNPFNHLEDNGNQEKTGLELDNDETDDPEKENSTDTDDSNKPEEIITYEETESL